MNNTADGKVAKYTGKVGKCTSCRCQIFSGFNTQKNHQYRLNFDRVIGKIKRGPFLWTQCTLHNARLCCNLTHWYCIVLYCIEIF